VPDIPEIESLPLRIRRRLEAAITARQQAIAEKEALIAGYNADIESALARAGVTAVYCGEWRAAYVVPTKPSRRLDRKLLLKNGVSPRVIQASEVEGKVASPYVVVAPRKDRGAGDKETQAEEAA
jgi:hypothetical protein